MKVDPPGSLYDGRSIEEQQKTAYEIH